MRFGWSLEGHVLEPEHHAESEQDPSSTSPVQMPNPKLSTEASATGPEPANINSNVKPPTIKKKQRTHTQ